ncbi:ATP synthase subunit I [Parablautia intestinalis]|uniref:ATP synthase subunit I n=2 Tax=Parablautia intestinalis TaxID=2320100 RepID=A0A3A9AGP2_9FIRM|nr:ATP synthase subunit I [Lachnospiraceae bacterium]MDE7047786.1 ATP synthase subunit I [Lachnospiraceae bacterium]RKI90519.1 ATP synthase subunit I [Parablautia intestinalis]
MRMKEKIIRINRTLFELETGILIFGAVCQLFAFLTKDKAGYSLGLWLGILTAAVSAFHMWWSLDRALDFPEKEAVKSLSTHNILRYGFITAVLMLIAVSGRADPLAAFLGIMGLKASAYMHFITQKVSKKIYGEEDILRPAEEPVDGQKV